MSSGRFDAGEWPAQALTPRANAVVQLRLPATSANLGPGFDALALALALYLEIEACIAPAFEIEASGWNPEICSRLDDNLLLEVYRATVQAFGDGPAPALAIKMRNGIPLGMGCGSSAASRLAGVALASYFGGLGWSGERILAEAARLEGHPDNVAACWLGGFVASAPGGLPGLQVVEDQQGSRSPAPLVGAVSFAPPSGWHAMLVLPLAPLATTASRAVLPSSYSRADTVFNLQRVALLTAAFASGRGELLAAATADRLHQPYRGAVCPLMEPLLPLAGKGGILCVSLSGAGPAILLLLKDEATCEGVEAQVSEVLSHRDDYRILTTPLAPSAPASLIERG